MKGKTYIIDTNVLVHDFHSFHNILKDNVVVIPYTVLEELDKLKTKNDEVGVNARNVIRKIEQEQINNNPRVIIAEVDNSIPGPDDRILEVCKDLREAEPTLVSKDVCLRTKARAFGIRTEDYKADKVEVSNLYTGMAEEIFVPADVVTNIYLRGEYLVEDIAGLRKHVKLYQNQAVTLVNDTDLTNRAYAIHKNGTLELIDNKVKPFDLTPGNLEQQILVNHLLDPEISLVTVTGGAGCYPKGTEFFTGTKWKPIEDFEEGDLVMQVDPDTLEGSLVAPEQYIKRPVDEFYQIKNRRVDFTTSKYHKHLTLNNKTKKYEVITTEELYSKHNSTKCGNNKKLITSFTFEGPGIPLTEDQIRLRIAIIADGYINPSNNRVQMSFKKERKIERFRALLEKAGLSYSEGVVAGFTRFWFVTDVYEKEFEEYWYSASTHQLQIIADEILKWDGSISEREGRKSLIAFHTTSQKSRDFIQYVFTVLGKNPTIYSDIREGRNTCYSVAQNNSQGFGIAKNPRAKSTTEITLSQSEDGLMYCFTVPTGFFAVRQNNQIFVSGNSGKTLVAVASALESVMVRDEYSKVTVARPIMPFQKDIGFLPGDIAEKVSPWFMPIVDNLDFLMPMAKQPKSKSGARLSAFEELQAQGILEMCPLTFIRGRSMPDQYIIVDEAQQVTVTEMKTILTRVGQGTKIVLTGDYSQIDNPYLSADSNGLVHCVEKFKDESIAAHISLQKCERSELAEISSKLL